MLKIAETLRKKLKWGIAGCGRFTENGFLPTIKLLRKSVVQSVFSKDPARAKYISEKFSISDSFFQL